jgi:hypothetical protein
MAKKCIKIKGIQFSKNSMIELRGWVDQLVVNILTVLQRKITRSRRIWVPPVYNKVWNPAHYNRKGRWVPGRRIEIERE